MNLRNLVTSLLIFSALIPVYAEVAGKYSGNLLGLELILHIEQSEDNGIKISLDSPMQGAYGLPASSASLRGDSVSFSINSLALAYEGVYNDNSITGIFTQRGASFPLTFTKQTPEEKKETSDNKYINEEVTFGHGNVTLAGTLSIPKGEVRGGLVLVSGSGIQDRDENLLGHKPFYHIAHRLASEGWVILRYDDRGAGKSSAATGEETTFDIALDAQSAMDYLRSRSELTGKKAGWLGHSEGAIVAMINSARNPDSSDFIISMGGPGLPGQKIIPTQARLIALATGNENADEVFASSELMCSSYSISEPEERRKSIESYIEDNVTDENAKTGMRKILLSPWYITFMTLDPAEYLKDVECPVLAVAGEFDAQVEPYSNTAAIVSAAPQTEVRILPGTNHLMQKCPEFVGSFNYMDIKEDISEEALDLIASWLATAIN